MGSWPPCYGTCNKGVNPGMMQMEEKDTYLIVREKQSERGGHGDA